MEYWLDTRHDGRLHLWGHVAQNRSYDATDEMG